MKIKIFFCGENDKHEMHVISVETDSDEELLIVNFSQFSPPTYGSSDWVRMDVDTGLTLRIQKTLNFGLLNTVTGKSADERCHAGFLTMSFLGSAVPGKIYTLVCSYSNNASLPIPDDLIKKKGNIAFMSNCEE